MGKSLIIKGADFSSSAIPVVKPIILVSDLKVATITDEDASSIYYTTDGSMPSIESYQYSSPFSIIPGSVIKAFSVYPDGKVSDVATYTDTDKIISNQVLQDYILNNVAISGAHGDLVADNSLKTLLIPISEEQSYRLCKEAVSISKHGSYYSVCFYDAEPTTENHLTPTKTYNYDQINSIGDVTVVAPVDAEYMALTIAISNVSILGTTFDYTNSLYIIIL